MTVKAEKLVKDIQDLLNKGVIERNKIFAKICEKTQINKRTFDTYLALARKNNTELAHKAETTLANTYINSIDEALKQGLKSKLQRVMEKQADVDRLRKLAKDGMADDVYFDSKGKPKDFKRKMTPTEIGQVLKHATAIEAEISKIMDDYPIQKHQIQAQIIYVTVANDQNETEDAEYSIPEVE
jgi:hypothetical protein